MSIAARQAVVDSPHTFFQKQSQRDDLLDPAKTDTNLIALIEYLLDRGHFIEFTAVRSDHHIDGPKGHNPGGLAFDCWPLKSPVAGDYLDATDDGFAWFVKDVASFKGLYQLGLAGSADNVKNVTACGLPYNDFSADPCVFSDGGGDHAHCGVHPA